ncbi:hypothetical protein [Corynebacterium lowii]|nr:hypothetical protein [Corynebacterium lowii]MDP9852416.1 hypothetical protein [Corynebacterium lowii]
MKINIMGYPFSNKIHKEPVLPEPTWARNIASINPVVLNAAIAISSILASSFFNKNWIAFALALAIIIACFILDNLRDRRNFSLEEEWDKTQRDAIESIIKTLTDGTQGIGDALHISDKKERDKQIAAARKAIMSVVRERIGPNEGVRANLFEVHSDDPIELKASPFVHGGRQNHHSSRRFTLEDESLRIAVESNQGRYEPDTTDFSDTNGKPLEYGCFAVMPVSTGDKLFRLLTVDSEYPWDIDNFHGKILLNHFASLLCLTYIKDENAKSIPIATARDTE